MIAGALAQLSVSVIFSENDAFAQIKPDATLGGEKSVVKSNLLIKGLPSDRIEGGAIRGANLFHSFREFNIDEGQGAYFTNPTGIKNILSRVTGSNASNILGTLGVTGGNANLFLMNPNGIIFGPNASLDMGNKGLEVKGSGGSFVATTANAILLGKTGKFSASESARSNLLSFNPSALFFNAVAAQAIVNQSTATTTVTESSTNGLQVPNGRSLHSPYKELHLTVPAADSLLRDSELVLLLSPAAPPTIAEVRRHRAGTLKIEFCSSVFPLKF